MTKITLAGIFVALVLGAAGASAAEPAPPAALPGFYGGVSLRDAQSSGLGVDLTAVSSAWIKYGATMADDGGPHALLFGGYRFGGNVSVEAAVARSDAYAIVPGRPGMGLALDTPGELPAQRTHADLYTSYNFGPAFALYGRVGYQQTDALPAYLMVGAGGVTVRQGVNYGVGLRYDMSPSLGLKLEYARFGRLGFDTFSGAFPESDQVQLGVQYRF